jgi:hypothetical protein
VGATACPHPLLAIMRLIQGLARGGGRFGECVGGGVSGREPDFVLWGVVAEGGAVLVLGGGGPCVRTPLACIFLSLFALCAPLHTNLPLVSALSMCERSSMCFFRAAV